MTRKLHIDDLLSFQLAGSVQLSPDGQRVAYVVSRVGKEKNEYQTSIHMAVAGRAPARFTGGESDSQPRFSPDGRRLAFVSRRSGQPQIWVMPTEGGEARQLTRVQGGVTEFAWSPDGARIAFTALLSEEGVQPEVKDEKEEDLLKKHTRQVKTITEQAHKMDGEGYYDQRRPCLCVALFEEGEELSPLQLTHPPYRVAELTWTPDSSTLLFASRRGEGYDGDPFYTWIYAIDCQGGEEPRRLTPATLGANAPRVSPDGRTLAFISSEPRRMGYDNGTLCLMPMAGGDITPVARQWDRPLSNIGLSDMPAPGGFTMIWAPDGRAIYALSSTGGTVQIVRVDVASGAVTPLTQGDHLIYCFALDAACRTAAFGMADPLNPGDIFQLDFASGDMTRLTKCNAALLAELELSEPQRFFAQAPDGPRVDGWVMKPHGLAEGERYPTILSIHGGPMMMYAAAFFFEFQLLAGSGYGVIYANPRGSQGYGEAFCEAISTEWGNRDYADLMAILDQAIAANAWIDTDRLGVTGGSYGGFMTNWIVSHTDRFASAVTGRSICDWRNMVGTGDAGPYWIQKFGGVAPWVDDTRYKEQSPITYVENVKTPILIEHQEGDLRCPLDQAQLWYTAIKYLGKAPVRLVTYPGEFHGMSRNGKPWNRIHRLREILNWFGRYLQPAAHQVVEK